MTLGAAVDAVLPEGAVLRPAALEADTPALMAIRESYQHRLRITGFLDRPEAAWRQLLPIVGQVYVIIAADGVTILAYCISAKKNGVYRVCDFAVAEGISAENARTYVRAAVHAAMRADNASEGPGGPDSSEADSLHAILPFAFLRWIDARSAPDASVADSGWMVRPTSAAGDEGSRICKVLTEAAEEGRFLLCPADSF